MVPKLNFVKEQFHWETKEQAIEGFSQYSIKESKKMLLKMGEIPPTMYFLVDDSKEKCFRVFFFPTEFRDNIDKIVFASATKAFITHINSIGPYKILSTVFTSEAWSSKVKTEDHEKGNYIRPSEDPNRAEILMFAIETETTQKATSFEFIKNYSGDVVISDKPFQEIEDEAMEGLFCNFLKK